MNDNYKGTEHYTLTKTENGWHGDPDDCEWQWFDFPDLTFTDDGDCRFDLEGESIDAAVDLEVVGRFGQVAGCHVGIAARRNAERGNHDGGEGGKTFAHGDSPG